MKAYTDYEKRLNITDCIINREIITGNILQQLRNDKLLEDYDLFEIVTDNKYKPYVYYKAEEDKFYVIRALDKSIGEFTDNDIARNKYRIKMTGTGIYENGVQDFERRSKKTFEELEESSKIQVILGEYMGLEMEEALDGLISALQDIKDVLKEGVESEK